jgi:hypothetical protein
MLFVVRAQLVSACVHQLRVQDHYNFAVNKIGVLRVEH